MEADTGFVLPQAKEWLRPLDTGQGRILQNCLQECGPADALISDSWSPKQWENEFLLFYIFKVGVKFFLQEPQETNTLNHMSVRGRKNICFAYFYISKA